MKETLLQPSMVLEGYDAVSRLYPFVPSLSHWRAWEYAAYRGFALDGRALDLGCGDGRYFQLLWPAARGVIGIDADEGAVDAARRSGVYDQVHFARAHEVPLPDASVESVFANCSLEHMDHLDLVLGEVGRCLKPGGTLLCSVVTDRFVSWSVLPLLVRVAGDERLAQRTLDDFVSFHHLANPLCVEDWCRRFSGVGLVAEQHIPIMPRYNSLLFLLADATWHVGKPEGGELGDDIYPALSANAAFPGAFRLVLEGLLNMETDWRTCSGAVFAVRKPW